ncbi:MAG: phage tail tape measure protein [Armatimonadota bacterium]
MMQDLGLGILVSMKDGFSQQAGHIQSSMQSLDATIAASSDRISRHMDQLQQGATLMGAGAALLAVPTALVASTTATQAALGEMASLGYQDFRALETAAEAFTNTYAGISKPAIISASYDIKSALSSLSDEAVGTFAQMAALTAKATKASTEEMVGTFTTAYGIFKPIMAEMSDMQWAQAFSGALAQTVQSFKTTGAQMAEAIKNVGATAAASNIPLQEQLAILGQLQTTMPGSEAGTLYKAFIMKAAEAGQALGLSFVGPTGQLKGIIPILEAIKGKFPDLSQAAAQVQIKKAFGSDEAVKFLLQMSAGMGVLTTHIDTVGQALQSGTALTERMARAMNADLGSQIGLIGQQSKNLSEILGVTLLPVAIPLLQGVQRIILGMQGWAKANPGLTRGVLLLSMALGTLLVVVGGAIAGVGTIGLALPAIQAGIAAIGPAITGALATVAPAILPALAILAGAMIIVWLLMRAWETNFAGIRDVVVGTWQQVTLAFQGIRALVTSLSEGTGQMSETMARQLDSAGLLGFVTTVFMVYYRVREFLQGLWQSFSTAFTRIRTILEPAVRELLGAFGGLVTALGQLIGVFGQTANAADGDAFRRFGQGLGSVIGAILTVTAYLLRGLVWALALVVIGVSAVVHAFAWIAGHAVAIWSGIQRTVVGILTGIVTGFITTTSQIKTMVLAWAGPLRTVATILGMIFGPALIRTGIHAMIAGGQVTTSFIASLWQSGVAAVTSAGQITATFVASMIRTGTLAVILGTQQLKWVILGFLESGKNAVIAAAQIGGSLVMAMVRYAASGWQVVGALGAQGAAWVATRVQALAATGGLIAQQVVMSAGTVATWAATVATAAFGAALTFVTGPIGLVCLAIVALIAIGILVWKNWDTISAFLLTCWNGIKTGVTIAFTAVVGFLKRWGLTILAVLAGPVGWVTLLIVKNWSAISGFLTRIWQGITNGARALWDGIAQVGASAWSGITAGFRSIGQVATAVWQGIVAGAQWLWNAILTVGRLYIGLYLTAFRLLWQGAVAVWQGMTAAAHWAWQSIVRVGQWAWGMLIAGWNILQTIAAQVWHGMQAAASACWQGLVALGQIYWTVVTAPFTWIAGIAQMVWTSIPTAATAAWGILQGLGTAALGWIAAPFQRLATWGVSAWSTITTAASNAFSFIRNLLTNLASTALESGRKLMTTIADGIKSAVMAPYDALKEGLAKARKLLPFSDAQEGPLSALTRSGAAVLETMSAGMRQASALPAQALHGAFSALRNLPAVTVPFQPTLAMATPLPLPRTQGIAPMPVYTWPVSPISQEHTVMTTPILPTMPGMTPAMTIMPPPMVMPGERGTPASLPPVPGGLPVEQTHLLAQTRTVIASPTSPSPTTPGATNDLHAVLEKLDSLGTRPLEVTVISKLDGREIARAVYRDLREQKIRNYETLS